MLKALCGLHKAAPAPAFSGQTPGSPRRTGFQLPHICREARRAPQLHGSPPPSSLSSQVRTGAICLVITILPHKLLPEPFSPVN